MIEGGADLSIKNQRGETPFDIAVRTKNNDFLKAVISSGAKLPFNKNNTRDFFLIIEKNLPDFIAFVEGHIEFLIHQNPEHVRLKQTDPRRFLALTIAGSMKEVMTQAHQHIDTQRDPLQTLAEELNANLQSQQSDAGSYLTHSMFLRLVFPSNQNHQPLHHEQSVTRPLLIDEVLDVLECSSPLSLQSICRTKITDWLPGPKYAAGSAVSLKQFSKLTLAQQLPLPQRLVNYVVYSTHRNQK